MGSDKNHSNVLLIVRDKVTRQCPQITISEEKAEPKRIRTEVPLLTSLTQYRYAKQAHSQWNSFVSLCSLGDNKDGSGIIDYKGE